MYDNKLIYGKNPLERIVSIEIEEGQGIGTQDLYFWGDARKYGYRCAIDCNVKVGHYDYINDMMW